MSERHDASAFRDQLGRTFRMGLGADNALDLELIEVRDLGKRRGLDGGPELSCYALIFRAPTRSTAPAAVYRLEHATLGALDVFLVPIGADTIGMRYEAIFN